MTTMITRGFIWAVWGMLSSYLLKGDHLGTGHESTGTTVLDRLVSDGEFTQVVTDEVGLDFDIDELLTIVDSNDGTDHFWENDSVTEVGLDGDWLLTIWALLLGLGQLFNQSHWTSLDASGKLSSMSCVKHLDDISGRHVQELLELNTSEGELSEGTGLLLLSKIDRVQLSHDLKRN